MTLAVNTAQLASGNGLYTDVSGNVGIGTSSPVAKLDAASGAVSRRAQLGNISNFPAFLCRDADGTTVTSGFWDATQQIFTNGGTERARIDPTGNLLVGLTSGVTHHAFSKDSPSNWTLGVQNTSGTSPFGMYLNFTAASPNNTSQVFLNCGDSNATRAQIRSNGGIANFSANNVNLSDARLKTAVQQSGSYLAKICAIPVVTYLYKDQTDTERNLGVLAQDVEAVAPELVDLSGFGEAPEGEPPYKAVYQTDLQYALMKCIQELKAEVDALRAQVEAK